MTKEEVESYAENTHHMNVCVISDIILNGTNVLHGRIKGSIKAGTKGSGLLSLYNPATNMIPVWFKKHRTEYYWYPLWVDISNLELITKTSGA